MMPAEQVVDCPEPASAGSMRIAAGLRPAPHSELAQNFSSHSRLHACIRAFAQNRCVKRVRLAGSHVCLANLNVQLAISEGRGREIWKLGNVFSACLSESVSRRLNGACGFLKIKTRIRKSFVLCVAPLP